MLLSPSSILFLLAACACASANVPFYPVKHYEPSLFNSPPKRQEPALFNYLPAARNQHTVKRAPTPLGPQYYNCTGTSSYTESKKVIGFTYMLIGWISQLIYILVLYTIFYSKPLFALPCYKIMFFLGIPDVLSLFFCADLAGLYSIFGIHPCYSIKFTFTTGCLVFGLWHMSCMYVLLLAFNRVCELVSTKKCEFLFRNFYLKILLFLPVPYFIYFTFFTKPTFFNSSASAFFLNPMSEATKSIPSEHYTVEAYVFNNFFVIISIGSSYLIICTHLIIKSWKIKIVRTSILVRRVTYQCLIVCTCHFIGCFLYVYIQYFWIPEFLSIFCHLAWIGNHSLPPYVYIIFNPSIRSDIRKLLFQFQMNNKTENENIKEFKIVRQAY